MSNTRHVARGISTRYIRALKEHLRIPLFRNAYYLIGNTGLGSLFGFIFWMVAARLYTPHEVGLGSAIISAMLLLASLSTLGLGFGLIRFLPSSGMKASSMINSSFSLSGLVSILVAAIFLAGLGLWSPTLVFIREHPAYIIFFLVFTVISTLYSILNQVFVAKRSAKFTLIKNCIANSLKIVLVIVLCDYFGTFAIFSATGLATAVAVAASLFWFLPRIQKYYLPVPALKRDTLSPIIRYSLGNHFAFLFWVLPPLILPLMVVNVLSAEANAYFFVTWFIGALLFAVPDALSTSLFAEGSYEEKSLRYNMWRSVKMTSLILFPLILIIFFLGDKVLLLFGKSYAQEGVSLLRLLSLSAIPLSVNIFYFNVKRVRKETSKIVISTAAIAFISLGLSYPLMLRQGLHGVGLSWLIAQSLVALVVIVLILMNWRSHSAYIQPQP